MKPGEAPALDSDAPRTSPRYFTVAQANQALVLVRRIVQDIVVRYQELAAIRDELDHLGETVGAGQRADALRRRGDELTGMLQRLHDELSEIGCLLKDWQLGLVDFPARHEGRDVELCWKLGEDAVCFWHDAGAGFPGRRPTDGEFAA